MYWYILASKQDNRNSQYFSRKYRFMWAGFRRKRYLSSRSEILHASQSIDNARPLHEPVYKFTKVWENWAPQDGNFYIFIIQKNVLTNTPRKEVLNKPILSSA